MFSQFRCKGLDHRASRRNTRQAHFHVDGLEDRRLMATSISVEFSTVISALGQELGQTRTSTESIAVSSINWGASGAPVSSARNTPLRDGNATLSSFSVVATTENAYRLVSDSLITQRSSMIKIETVTPKPGSLAQVVDYYFDDARLENAHSIGSNDSETPMEDLTFVYKSVTVNSPPAPTIPINPGPGWTTVG